MADPTRDQAVWDAYTVRNQTARQVAEQLGITTEKVYAILARVRSRIPEAEKTFVIDRRIGQINAAVSSLLPDILAGDKDAITSWVKLADREARYLGLDSAKRVQVSGGVRYEVVMEDDQ